MNGPREKVNSKTLQLVGFRKLVMSALTYVTRVRCVKIHKRTGAQNALGFELVVHWSDGRDANIIRPYTTIFDFLQKLREEYPEFPLPELKAAKWFESLWKARKDDKKKAVEEFFSKILSLPETVVRGHVVCEFFAFSWSEDDRSEAAKFQNNSETTELSNVDSVIEPIDGTYETVNVDFDSYNTLSFKPKEVLVVEQKSLENENRTYWAVSEYSKRKSGEVDLKAGASVSVLQREFSGWWFVHVEDTNEQGWAPASCLIPVDPRHLEDTKVSGPFGEFKVLKDFNGDAPDELSCKEGDTVEVTQASLDGWWEVRCQNKVGIIPATNLEPVSNQTRVRNSLCHQVGMYKKYSPPPRRDSKISIEELYGKVNKFRDKGSNGLNCTVVAPDSKAEHTVGKQPPISFNEMMKMKVEIQDVGHEDDTQHFYMNMPDTCSNHPYINVELKPNQETKAHEIKYYRVITRHMPNVKHQGRPALMVEVGDIIESHIEELDKVFGKLFKLADGSQPDPKEGWIPLTNLEKCDRSELLPSVSKPLPAIRHRKVPSGPHIFNATAGNRVTGEANNNGNKQEQPRQPSPPADIQYILVTEKPTQNRSTSKNNQPFTVHKVNRVECENTLLRVGTPGQFIIRESTKPGHYAISVRSTNRVRHFPIEFTVEKTYFIGNYNFSSLVDVVSYYKDNHLFVTEDGIGIALSTSLESF